MVALLRLQLFESFPRKITGSPDSQQGARSSRAATANYTEIRIGDRAAQPLWTLPMQMHWWLANYLIQG